MCLLLGVVSWPLETTYLDMNLAPVTWNLEANTAYLAKILFHISQELCICECFQLLDQIGQPSSKLKDWVTEEEIVSNNLLEKHLNENISHGPEQTDLYNAI